MIWGSYENYNFSCFFFINKLTIKNSEVKNFLSIYQTITKGNKNQYFLFMAILNNS